MSFINIFMFEFNDINYVDVNILVVVLKLSKVYTNINLKKEQFVVLCAYY